MKPSRINQLSGSRSGDAPQPRGLAWALRWLLVMVLVFDQLSAPFHHHHHDFGIDADVGLAASHSHDLSVGAVAFDSHADDDHDAQVGHAAMALRPQRVSELTGVRLAADALMATLAFVVVFPTLEVDTPVPDWPDRGPPLFASFKSLPPAGRAPPLHA